MQQGKHFLEIHVDFDKLINPFERYPITFKCVCGKINERGVFRHEVHLMKGGILYCTCGNSIVIFGNHFETKVNE